MCSFERCVARPQLAFRLPQRASRRDAVQTPTHLLPVRHRSCGTGQRSREPCRKQNVRHARLAHTHESKGPIQIASRLPCSRKAHDVTLQPAALQFPSSFLRLLEDTFFVEIKMMAKSKTETLEEKTVEKALSKSRRKKKQVDIYTLTQDRSNDAPSVGKMLRKWPGYSHFRIASNCQRLTSKQFLVLRVPLLSLFFKYQRLHLLIFK